MIEKYLEAGRKVNIVELQSEFNADPSWLNIVYTGFPQLVGQEAQGEKSKNVKLIKGVFVR